MTKYLTTGEVADIFHVHPNTVALWVENGKLACVRTPGGHRRFDPVDVEQLKDGLAEPQDNGHPDEAVSA